MNFLVTVWIYEWQINNIAVIMYYGILIDSRLTMADHVTAICRSAYYQLHQLCSVVQLLTSDAAMTKDATFEFFP